VVLAPVAGVKFAEASSAQPGPDQPSIRERRWQKEFVTGKSAKETVKTTVQGKPEADSNGRRNTTLWRLR